MRIVVLMDGQSEWTRPLERQRHRPVTEVMTGIECRYKVSSLTRKVSSKGNGDGDEDCGL
jgi:hypothetical protein